MKLGILTFHSQLNYGGVLQAYALQSALESMGYEVSVIDRWLSDKNDSLLGPFSVKLTSRTRIRYWARLLIRGCLGAGDFAILRRHLKTTHFVRTQLHLTPYHFRDWQEIDGKNLALDGIVVGSDQVWNCTWGSPAPYLLEGMTQHIPAISYAASFGIKAIPTNLIHLYKAGFNRFKAISVREKEGLTLVASCDATATHVSDPTLIAPKDTWERLVKPTSKKRKTLVCYFLSERVPAILPRLRDFSKAHDCNIKVFHIEDDGLLSFGTIKKKPLAGVIRALSNTFSRVQLASSADPTDFVNAFANATWVISDSFHALMFSTIFQRNVRILSPKDEGRVAMFARIEEFVQQYTHGPVIAPDLSTALDSLANGTQTTYNIKALDEFREHSRAWLKHAIDELH